MFSKSSLLRLTVCLWAMLATAAGADSKPQVKIGAILPFSGDARAYAEEARMALEHAIKDSPDTKFEYKLILEDDRFTAAAANAAAQKLMAIDSAPIIFSNWSYGGSAVASAVRGRPAVHLAFAWDPAVAGISGNNFLIAPPPGKLAQAAVRKMKAEGAAHVGLVQFQESGSEFAMDEVERACKQEGIEIVRREKFSFSDMGGIKSAVARLKRLKADYIVASLPLTLHAELFRGMKMLKFDIPVASLGQTPEAQELAAIHPATWWSADYSANPASLSAIQKRTGLKDLAGYTAYYDALKAVISVYESAPDGKIPDLEWVIAALNSFNAKMSYLGNLTFDGRIRQSDQVVIVDQAEKYRPPAG